MTAPFKVADEAVFEIEEIIGRRFKTSTHTIIRLLIEKVWLQGNAAGYREALEDSRGSK